ncbi:hypothetical protein ACS0TY_002425 [Phlomoides rotata]
MLQHSFSTRTWNMQSYPYHSQQDHMYHGPHWYPGMENIPTQGYGNPVRPPMGYGFWPWGSSYGGASPIASHGCCNHSYFPAHSAWGSPYSHVATHHCPQNYPSFPVQYMPPPPYYANMPGEHHCCGCLNHPLHHNEQKNVRIEEEEPERERRKDRSVVPYEFHNSPYPIAWLPPDYCSNKEQGMVKRTGDMGNGSPDVKANENAKVAAQQPTFQNGWLPLDLNNLVLPKNKGDGEGNQQDDAKRNFPYPLFWIPYKHEEKEKEDHKEKDASVKPSLELEAGSDGEQRFHANKESFGDRAAKKARDIPVKQAEQRVEKETSMSKEKERDASDVVGKENGKKKVDNGGKVSPKEGSKKKPQPKLPPVCLRVDPLPRTKSENGSSWSPSPPNNKQKQSNDASRVLNPSGKKEQAKILPNELKEDKSTKIIEVVDGRTSQGTTVDVEIVDPVKEAVKSQADVSMNQYADNVAVTKGQSEDAGLAGEKKEVSSQAQDMKADEVEKPCKARLSEEEAAVIIQSAYRGLDVRRWEPIKKLKQIAKVREQIADVKDLIQAMKSSFDIQNRSKQRNIVAETIMSLLLKLDTIQGLTPSIREVRKSVVRELVSLQEQLDPLMNEKIEDSPGTESVMAHEDSMNRNEDVTTTTDVLEAHQDQTDGGSNNENTGTSEADLIGEQATEKIEKEATEICTDKGVESAPEPTFKEDEKRNEVLINDEMIAEKVESEPEPTIKEDEKSTEVLINGEMIAEKDHEDVVLGQGSGIPLQEDSSPAKPTDIMVTDRDTVGSELAELPIGVLDDICTEEGRNDALAEADVSSGDKEKQQLVGALTESPIISEQLETAENNDRCQPMECHEVPDLTFNIVNVEPDTEETCPVERPLDDKFGREEEVDGNTGDAGVEPDDYTVQQQLNVNAPDEIENHTTHENETPSNLVQLPNSSANSDEAGAEAKSDDQRIDSDSRLSTQQSVVAEEMQQQITQASQSDDRVSVNVPEECNTRQPTPTEVLEDQCLKDASPDATDPTSAEDSPARDEVMESNRRLNEENERLRNMMENLIKSSEEQLTVISSLSGRVKDLEKKLSRKKKLKVKQYRAPRSRSSCMTKGQ